jgi:hypothetical protein
MKARVVVAVWAAVMLGVFAWLGGGRASASEVSPLTAVHSSSLILGGRVRCTASVDSEVQAGQPLSVKFVLRNISKRSIKFYGGFNTTWLVVTEADGTTYDTRVPDEGVIPPGPVPIKIRPRARLRLGSVGLPVRWSGPLQITPDCFGRSLPSLGVAVTAPGPPPEEGTAFGEVVAAAGFLLDNCRPQASGVPVDGQIDPPSGTAPPMSAQCSLSMTSEGTFWVAQILVITPPGLQGVAIREPYELFEPPYGFGGSSPFPPAPFEAIAWQFVVTADGPVPVAAAGVLAMTGSATQSAPSFGWNGTTWQEGGLPCGGEGSWEGGTYPGIAFISACPA